MAKSIIKGVEAMIQKEQAHLNWLNTTKKSELSIELIKSTTLIIADLQQRHAEYTAYFDEKSTQNN